MGFFKDQKTETEKYIENNFNFYEDFSYNIEIEIEDEGEFVEIKQEEEVKDANTICTDPELSEESRTRIPSRSELFLDLLKCRRPREVQGKLRTIWKRLRQDFRS